MKNRTLLFSMVDLENKKYNLYDKNNNLVSSYSGMDTIYKQGIIKIIVELKMDNNFYLTKVVHGDPIASIKLPVRTNLLWATNDKEGIDCPFKPLQKANNRLEKFIIFNCVLDKNIIHYSYTDNPPIDYYIDIDKDKNLRNIYIYNKDDKVRRHIVKELKELGVGL